MKNAIEWGELLIEVKNVLNHGEFRDWILKNCDGISLRTAQNYMTLANGKDRIKNEENIRKAYTILGIIKNPI